MRRKVGSLAERLPHADLDLEARLTKARKIEVLLRLPEDGTLLRLLEVGTGAGVIAHYFATHSKLNVRATAVDVIDQRAVSGPVEFHLVQGTQLPFGDMSFDVVISNHVIEHVGRRQAQLEHLSEVKRVLAEDGVGYLAVPNRWSVVEPHYRLLFLSWLPRSVRTRFLRLSGRGVEYDCEPLSPSDLDGLLSRAGFSYTHMETEAVSLWLLERMQSVIGRFAMRLPTAVLQRLTWAMPTLICLLRPLRDEGRSSG